MKSKFRMSSEDAHHVFRNENDVIDCEERRQLRMHDLRRAAILGTVYNQESRIEFEEKPGKLSTLISKIIGVTDRNVIARNHKLIPIHSISRVVV